MILLLMQTISEADCPANGAAAATVTFNYPNKETSS